MKKIFAVGIVAFALLLIGLATSNAAALLPNGRQQFIAADGSPCNGCKVFFYAPNTTVPKDTWIDAGQSTLNTNPVTLDALGSAVIYGSGVYRQILKSATGITLWDQLTSDPVSLNAGFGGISTGSANAQAICTLMRKPVTRGRAFVYARKSPAAVAASGRALAAAADVCPLWR